jgi:hypothetical protein
MDVAAWEGMPFCVPLRKTRHTFAVPQVGNPRSVCVVAFVRRWMSSQVGPCRSEQAGREAMAQYVLGMLLAIAPRRVDMNTCLLKHGQDSLVRLRFVGQTLGDSSETPATGSWRYLMRNSPAPQVLATTRSTRRSQKDSARQVFAICLGEGGRFTTIPYVG